MINVIKRYVAKRLNRLVLYKSQEFQVTVLDIVSRTQNLRGEYSPVSRYLDWRHDEIKRLGLDSYPDNPVLGDIYHSLYGKIDRIALAISFLKGALCVPGDVAEFGTYKGHTAISLDRTLDDAGSDKQLFLFDSFAGMPESSYHLDGAWAKGDLISDEQELKELFKDSPRVNIVPGYFSETFPHYPNLRFSFCHVDADLYTSVKECIQYILPRLSIGGVIVFDDYGFPGTPGAKAAITEALGGDTEAFVPLPTAQAVYFCRAGDGVPKN